MNTRGTTIALAIWFVLALMLQGCAFGAGAATGAAATEVLHEEGYELDSPIEEEDEDE